MNSIIPIPRVPIKVREATLADLPFIDSLQKIHNKQVGFLHRETLEGKINLKHVIVAEESGERVGYCIGNDKYFKHENVGVIYQLNVAPGKQRNLVGAHLVGGMFDRAAYGCTLFCLWCAQDIQANFFWESIGFVPLAFRAGSRKRDRVHIFWEKRIREGDTTTPWWYPTETTGGSIGEDRLVFPIPPGMLWSDPMPRILPESGVGILPAPAEKKTRGRDGHAKKVKLPSKAIIRGGFRFAVANDPSDEAKPKRQKTPKAKVKNDPALIAKARELNGRWMEVINNDPNALPAAARKYAVSRQIESPHPKPAALLEAA